MPHSSPKESPHAAQQGREIPHAPAASTSRVVSPAQSEQQPHRFHPPKSRSSRLQPSLPSHSCRLHSRLHRTSCKCSFSSKRCHFVVEGANIRAQCFKLFCRQ